MLGAAEATPAAESGVTASSSTAQSSSVETKDSTASFGECSAPDTVLLQLVARRRTAVSHDEPRQSPSSKTTSTTSQLDDDTATTETSTSANRRMLSPTRSYRLIATAISTSAKHLRRAVPPPVDSNFITATKSKTRNHAHPAVERTSVDDVTGRSVMTSPSRPHASTNDNDDSSSTVKSCVSEPKITADADFTAKQLTWLREVGRCLNPHRRHQWSHQFTRRSSLFI